MEENKNKSNTLLLTVIAVATLLVAVIGATFAYFTANIDSTQTSTIEVTGAKLTISYAGNSSTITATAKNPQVAAIGTKTFTLSGINSTTDMSMPYTLYLVVNTNEFVLANATTGTSLSYTLEQTTSDTAAIPDNGSGVYGAIPTTVDVSQLSYAHTGDTNYDQLTDKVFGSGDGKINAVTIDDGNGNTTDPSVYAVKIGVGYFAPHNPSTQTATNHTYTLTLYFMEDNKNQDEDKGKSFTGYVAVGAGTQAIASSVTAVNCANTPASC